MIFYPGIEQKEQRYGEYYARQDSEGVHQLLLISFGYGVESAPIPRVTAQ